MKTVTRNDYLRRIDRVVALLQQAVTQGSELPELGELAQATHLSPFHFHRVYRALTGETIGRTVARLRLLRALQLLSDPELAVTDAALAIGHETPQAFARAFRQAFDASPSELRVQPAPLASELARLSRAPVDEAMPASPLQVEVVSLEPFSLVATRNTGDFADLAVAYEALFGWVAEHGLIERIAGIYGVPWQDRRNVPAAECEFDCALAFEGDVAAGEGTLSLRLGGGQWADCATSGRTPGWNRSPMRCSPFGCRAAAMCCATSRCFTTTSTIRSRRRRLCCARISTCRSCRCRDVRRVAAVDFASSFETAD